MIYNGPVTVRITIPEKFLRLKRFWPLSDSTPGVNYCEYCGVVVEHPPINRNICEACLDRGRR